MALPDFFVAGAPKAGTTALHAALAQHPALYLSAVKEPKYFLTDGPPPARGGPGDALTYREHVWRRADYEALFAPAPPGTLTGESTPLYLYDRPIAYVLASDAAERIHQAFEAGRRAGIAEVGIPTTQPILGVADEEPPDYRADRTYIALSPHRSVASRT